MESLSFMSKAGSLHCRKKGDHVFRQGDKDRNIYVIKNGLLKAYYLSEDGKEHVKSLLVEGAFIGSMTACHSGQGSSFSLVCLEDSELIALQFDELKTLAENNLDVAQFVINGLLELSMKKERREYEFLCMSATDRYQAIRDRDPALLERVTQNDIARYLGVTPVALSRIKSRL